MPENIGARCSIHSRFRIADRETAAEWARDQVPVWTWDIRWFQPGETEEWMAYVGVDGDIVGFR